MSLSTLLTHERLSMRYRFTGTLALETGLHIGSGIGSTRTDALVMRTADGEPYIPGSSFKGALRSAVERIAPNIPGIGSCQLIENGETECLTITRNLQTWLQEIREHCDTAERTGLSYQKLVAQTGAAQRLVDRGICTTQELDAPIFARMLPYHFIEHTLCDTCKLFGSTSFAAKVRVSDLHIEGPWVEMTEIRDGVGIDRDTETAKPRIKFDLEVVPAQTDFTFRLDADNLNKRDLGLLCIGLQEFRSGVVPLGGRSTRGLGSCRLELSGIYEADLSNLEALTRYLTATKDAERMTLHATSEGIDEFISASIRALLTSGDE
jgi:CRISPR-associated protein Csm3